MLNGLPPNNPVLAWVVIIASILVAIVPAVYNRVRERHHDTGPIVVPTVLSSDTNVALTTLIKDLQQINVIADARADAADRRLDECMQRTADLRVLLAKSEERIERLNAQVQSLTDRLIQRG